MCVGVRIRVYLGNDSEDGVNCLLYHSPLCSFDTGSLTKLNLGWSFDPSAGLIGECGHTGLSYVLKF